MSRETPDRAHAAGMLEALVVTHTCGAACRGPVVIGRATTSPQAKALRCPYDVLDLDNPADRRIIGGLYAAEARAAMEKSS